MKKSHWICILIGIGIGILIGSAGIPHRHLIEPKPESARIYPETKLADQKVASPSGTESDFDISRRNDTYSWFTKKGEHISILATTGSHISPEVAILVGLMPFEIQRIDSVLAETQLRITNLRLASARSEVDPSKNDLTINLSPVGAEGTVCYQNVLNVVKDTMGPERFALFNQLAGESFDQAFEHYGADNVSYKIELTPKAEISGKSAYAYERSFSSVDHNSSGNSSGIASAATAEDDPVLKHFLQTLPAKAPDA